MFFFRFLSTHCSIGHNSSHKIDQGLNPNCCLLVRNLCGVRWCMSWVLLEWEKIKRFFNQVLKSINKKGQRFDARIGDEFSFYAPTMMGPSHKQLSHLTKDKVYSTLPIEKSFLSSAFCVMLEFRDPDCLTALKPGIYISLLKFNKFYKYTYIKTNKIRNSNKRENTTKSTPNA